MLEMTEMPFGCNAKIKQASIFICCDVKIKQALTLSMMAGSIFAWGHVGAPPLSLDPAASPPPTDRNILYLKGKYVYLL